MKMYEAIVKGDNIPTAGIPESLNMLRGEYSPLYASSIFQLNAHAANTWRSW